MDWGNTFVLMNKNTALLTFESIQGEFGSMSFEVRKKHCRDEQMPLGFQSLQSWIEKRQALKNREHIAGLLRQCGCYDLDGFIRISKALNLNDTFWIKPEKQKLQWEDVSLYRNPFNETIARIAFEGGLYGDAFSSTSPELGTDGAHAKCWIREDDRIYLLKRGTAGARNTGLEPYSEFYAAQISKFICEGCVSYDLVMHYGKLASKCKLFTNETIGFVPAWKVINPKATPNQLLAFFAKYNSEDAFRRMLVLDALILNTDRHMGNYGVICDNDAQEVLGMAPVFDNNQALLPYAEDQDFEDIQKYLRSRPTRIGVDFNEMAHWALTPEIQKDLINLKGFFFRRHEKYNLPEERLKILENVINQQINNILQDIRLYVPLEVKNNSDSQPSFTDENIKRYTVHGKKEQKYEGEEKDNHKV